MNHTKIHYFAILAGCLLFTTPLYTQNIMDMDNIDTILQDTAFNDLANRYASVLLSFFPERATRLGYSSANTKLDDRTPQHSAQALAALHSIRQQLETMETGTMSPSKKADRKLLLNDLDYMIWLEEQDRVSSNPLYYAEAFDAIYDLRLKQMASPNRQRLDILARLHALSKVADQAETYLTHAPAFQAQIAMEKAYYAFLSMDDLTEFLLKTSPDEDTSSQIKQQTAQAKHAIKRLFDLFKQLSRAENTYDFRAGEEAYNFLLKNQYQITEKSEKLLAQLEKKVQEAQQELTKSLRPFIQDIETEEITVLDGQEDETDLAVQKKESTSAKTKDNEPQGLLNAQDFYAVTKRIIEVEPPEDPLTALAQQAETAAAFFNEQGIFPQKSFKFNVEAMPQYFAYFKAYLLVPPYGNQYNSHTDFFLRLPNGNQLSQQEQLNRDFNQPVQKLMLTEELIPGRYYQTVATANLSAQRRFYPSKTIQNGWKKYAQQVALEKGFLITDEDLLFTAWEHYIQALQALADFKLHTRQFSYTDTLEFLTLEHGLEQDQADTLIKQIVSAPAEALSYQAGFDVLQNLRHKYQKKQGKKFKEETFHSYLLQAGNLTPDELEKEVARFYKESK